MTKKSLFQIYPKRLDIVLLIFASAVLLAAGLTAPVLTTRQMWVKNTFSIFSGIGALYAERHYFLSVVILFFSVIFPVAKLAALFGLWFFRLSDTDRKKLLHWLALLGKWSMLDVFVVAVLIVSVKLGALASARPEPGIYFFCISVLLAMLVTAMQNRMAKGAP